MIELTLPWPPRALWPNGRAHWSVKAGWVKKHRHLAWALLKEAQGQQPGATVGKSGFHLAYTFCPPPRAAHSFDLDNAAASTKSFTDGIAQALCVNDREFTFARPERGEPVKGGTVKVQLTWAP